MSLVSIIVPSASVNNKLVHRDEPRSIRPSVSVNNILVHRDEPRSISPSASVNNKTSSQG